MDIKVKAAITVAKVVGIAAVGSSMILLAITNIPLQYLGVSLGIFAVGYFLHIAYTIALSQLKYEEKLKEMSKK